LFFYQFNFGLIQNNFFSLKQQQQQKRKQQTGQDSIVNTNSQYIDMRKQWRRKLQQQTPREGVVVLVYTMDQTWFILIFLVGFGVT
jgi:uncharacterized membrane protein